MLIVSDVHAAFPELRKVAASGEPLLVLGDLLNFVDYRTGEGIASSLYGKDHADRFTRNRKAGNWAANRRLWREANRGREAEMARSVEAAVRHQYRMAREAMAGAEAVYLIPGNVDWPQEMAEVLADTVDLVDGEVVEIEGYRVGFAGGGVPTPAAARGEITHRAMAEKLAGLGPVDILCTHVAPSVSPLHRDVVTGRPERSSLAVLEFLETNQPDYHYFGDIHQPQAQVWRVGKTKCRNVGYFRATARAVYHAQSSPPRCRA